MIREYVICLLVLERYSPDPSHLSVRWSKDLDQWNPDNSTGNRAGGQPAKRTNLVSNDPLKTGINLADMRSEASSASSRSFVPWKLAMWEWFNCHLAGRHEYAVWSDSNRIYLRCLRCGRRSTGWDVASSEDNSHDHVHHSGTEERRTRRNLIAGVLSLIGLTLVGR